MRKFFSRLLLAGICAALLLYFRAPLLTAYAEFFTVHNATKGADALVVLAGMMETRMPQAVKLYGQEFAPRILITQERPFSRLAGKLPCANSDKALALLRLLNTDCPLTVVPSLKGGATSTFDEAYDLKDWCRKNGYRRIIIITDDFHTRRALYAFTKVFEGTGIVVEAAGAPNEIFSPQNWWKSDWGISAYVLEGIKYLVYLVTSRNAPIIKNF